MNLDFGTIYNNRHSNKVNRLEYPVYLVPFITTIKYFKNYENIYFLLLGIFQLLTLGILPKEWSPTGPFSTIIPLACCLGIEIMTAIAKWLDISTKDRTENTKEFTIINQHSESIIANQNIYPGHLLKLTKNEISPVDGILIYTTDLYGKVNLALLTGESNIHYVSKPIKDIGVEDYGGCKLINSELEFTNGSRAMITNRNMIHAGSIIKSPVVYIWTTACGKDKMSRLSKTVAVKTSRIDKFIGEYMMDISVKILISLVIIISLVKTWVSGELCIYKFGLFCIQNWILFNGVIPFSVKIFLLFSRKLISKFSNQLGLTINDPSQIDDIAKVQKIICDKTGTVTKNELEFTKLLLKNDSVPIDVNANSFTDIDHHAYNCLGLCINYQDDDFATVEDKIILAGFECLSGGINKTTEYEHVETIGLDFTFDRKMSSVIVKDRNDEYYIYSKGSIEMIQSKLRTEDVDICERATEIMIESNPELRLLAFAYKKIDGFVEKKIVENLLDSSESYDIFETDLCYSGIIGIKDILQPGVTETIEKIRSYGMECSLCTGDRKVTAIAVANEINMIRPSEIMIYDKRFNIDRFNNKTLVFDGKVCAAITDHFKECLLTSKNFIGYSMTPENKKSVVGALQNNSGIDTMAVGDGFNDLGMFDSTSISVAIKGNDFVENYTDYSISQFSDLQGLFVTGIQSYHKNAKLINFTFYRCSTVIFIIALHCLINYKLAYESPFNGFVIQAFNFAWTIVLLFYSMIQNVGNENDKTKFRAARNLSLTNTKHTSCWNICGIANGLIILSIINIFGLSNAEYFNDILALIVIVVLNSKLLLMGKVDALGTLAALIGVMAFIFYCIITNSLTGVIYTLQSVDISFWYVLATYACVNIL